MRRKSLKDKWKSFIVLLINITGGEAYLCDSCKFDYRTCTNPQRPNAIRCRNYRSRY
ncbi:hypothetical protein J7K97_03925 [Candidatus Aerophobetes bacterium]|nr:hypothetical protein [Candidatus Aerophobetes bacterium]